MRNGGYRIMTS